MFMTFVKGIIAAMMMLAANATPIQEAKAEIMFNKNMCETYMEYGNEEDFANYIKERLEEVIEEAEEDGVILTYEDALELEMAKDFTDFCDDEPTDDELVIYASCSMKVIDYCKEIIAQR